MVFVHRIPGTVVAPKKRQTVPVVPVDLGEAAALLPGCVAEQGSSDGCLYIVSKGSVDVFHDKGDGMNAAGTIPRGGFFGER